jgi:hypothetical protein
LPLQLRWASRIASVPLQFKTTLSISSALAPER